MIAQRDGLAPSRIGVGNMDSMDETQRKAVDWTKPIEAVHVSSGEVVPVEYVGNDGMDGHNREIKPRLVEYDCFACWFNDDGTRNGEWIIRNLQTTEPATTAIDPALVERMVALVKRLADSSPAHLSGPLSHEARDILKALEPVDPDEAIAEEIAASFNEGEHEAIALAALKRGRQLEREKIA